MKKFYVCPVASFEALEEEEHLCGASFQMGTNTTDYTDDPSGNYSDITVNDKPIEGPGDWDDDWDNDD